MIEDSFSAGYNWCVDAIKMSQHSQLANDLEINKAVMYLKQKEFQNAIDTLKAFEKQETKVASTASTNLSFLYFLQGDSDMAEKYAELAKDTDSYNAAAFVNLGMLKLIRYRQARVKRSERNKDHNENFQK
jgi:intraflagellar transport protein 88